MESSKKATKKKVVVTRTINLPTYLLMQATVFGMPSEQYKHLNIKQAKELVDQIMKENEVTLELETSEEN